MMTNTTTPPDNVPDAFVSDAPVTDFDKDRFKRGPFAKRVAQTIAARTDPSSIVLGICGAWGEGKTTILNFIEKELGKQENVIVLRFNPWRHVNEDTLLRSFFDALGSLLDSKLGKRAKGIKKLFTGLSSLGAWLDIKGTGKLFKLLQGIIVPSADLEKIKANIGEILKNESKRVVVLMDDIDRLDKTEISAIFKLVKLVADFGNTTYVLAFDDNMVAEALAEKYGTNKRAGKRFVEKIVQVPLRIPKADTLTLHDMCLESIRNALRAIGVQLTEREWTTFEMFSFSFQSRMHTPRIVKRYANYVAFALPILSGEVNTIDLMLIEGIRAFYSELYDFVRHNMEVFLGSWKFSNASNIEIQKFNEEREKKIKEILAEYPESDQEPAKNVLGSLFPQLRVVFEHRDYNAPVEDNWALEQRIASVRYFDRYFSYSVPDREVSDSEVALFLQECQVKGLKETTEKMSEFLRRIDLGRLAISITRHVARLSAEVSAKIALGLSQLQSQSEISEAYDVHYTGILIIMLVGNIPMAEERLHIAEMIVGNAASVVLAYECLRSMREKSEKLPLFTEEEVQRLGKALAKNISERSKAQVLYIRHTALAWLLLHAWREFGSREETSRYIANTLQQDPSNATAFLRCFVSVYKVGTMGFGQFKPEHYISVGYYVDQQVVFDALRKVYGKGLDSSGPNSAITTDQRLAQEFTKLHIAASPQEGPKNDSQGADHATGDNPVV